MHADVRGVDVRVDAPPSCGEAKGPLALHERLLISALVAGVSLWISFVEAIPDGHR
jgi:hypothetical protein